MRLLSRGPSRTFALGVWLATRGSLATISFIVAALGAATALVAAFAIARHGGRGLAQVPTLASEGIAWGAGSTLAFGTALRAVHRDREYGILALLRARGVSVGEYVRGRVGGLVVVLAGVVGGATLVAGLAATSAVGGSMSVVRASSAALVYAMVFAGTIGPIAMAALGARTRSAGYLTLIAVLLLPEVVSPWTSALLPRGWNELTSIPAALDAVGAGVESPLASGTRGARALAALMTVVAVSLLVVGARAGRAETEP